MPSTPEMVGGEADWEEDESTSSDDSDLRIRPLLDQAVPDLNEGPSNPTITIGCSPDAPIPVATFQDNPLPPTRS